MKVFLEDEHHLNELYYTSLLQGGKATCRKPSNILLPLDIIIMLCETDNIIWNILSYFPILV